MQPIGKYADAASIFLSDTQAVTAPTCRKAFLLIALFCLLFGATCVKTVILPREAEGWHVPLVNTWVTKGFFHSGGLTLYKGAKDDSERYIYTTTAPWVWYPMYLAQKAVYTARGTTSMKLWVGHNIILWGSSGFLIGLITFLLFCRQSGIAMGARVAIGACASAVYMTHPVVYSNIVLACHEQYAIIFILTLIAYEAYVHTVGDLAQRPCHKKIIFLLMLLVAIAGTPTAMIYAVSVVLFRLIKTWNIKDIGLKEYLLPVLIAMACAKIHMTLGELFLDNIAGTVHSTFRFRSGLDGASDYMKGDFFSLFTDRLPYPGPNVTSWGSFFFLGSIMLVVAILWGPRKDEEQQFCSTFLPLVMLAVFYQIVFAQGAIIHPYYYDCYIAIPYALCIYGMGTKILMRISPQTKHIALFMIIIISIALTMIDLRLVALDYPDPSPHWGEKALLEPV